MTRRRQTGTQQFAGLFTGSGASSLAARGDRVPLCFGGRGTALLRRRGVYGFFGDEDGGGIGDRGGFESSSEFGSQFSSSTPNRPDVLVLPHGFSGAVSDSVAGDSRLDEVLFARSSRPFTQSFPIVIMSFSAAAGRSIVCMSSLVSVVRARPFIRPTMSTGTAALSPGAAASPDTVPPNPTIPSLVITDILEDIAVILRLAMTPLMCSNARTS